MLEFGFAKVHSLTMPIQNPTVVAKELTHVFVDDANRTAATPLACEGVLCLCPEYIGDFLLQVSKNIIHSCIFHLLWLNKIFSGCLPLFCSVVYSNTMTNILAMSYSFLSISPNSNSNFKKNRMWDSKFYRAYINFLSPEIILSSN